MPGTKSLTTEYPELVDEWHPYKNGMLKPENVSPKSHKRIWWVGKCGHEWQSEVASRASGHGCPYCSGNRILSGFNDLSSLNPELASEWHPTKNGTLEPTQVTSTSHLRVWWLGKCGHEWEATVNHRAKSRGCPFCANRQVLEGYNDFPTTHSELAKEWHPSKNGDLKPETITAGSSLKVWWLGKCGHEWEAAVNSRASGRGCPICAGRQVLSGFNDLVTTNPDLAKEWHPKKNGDLQPNMVVAGAEKRVWWLCKNHHEWEASIKGRSKGNGCPICSGKKVLAGYNDLGSVRPDLAKEWNLKKNKGLTPEMVTEKSGKKVWWICYKGHEWEATIASRSDGRGCPVCNKETQTSFPEQAIYYYISRSYPEAINGDSEAIGIELDIYIPSLKYAVEYDGYHWHRNQKIEKKKNKLCAEKGIKLIRVREEGLPFYDDCICIRRNNRKAVDSLNEVIDTLLQYIPSASKEDVNVSRDETEILNEFVGKDKEKSLGIVSPELTQEWHPTRNGLLTPYSFSYGSKKRVWWLGKCGHEWQAAVVDRTVNGNGCPYCAGILVLKGFNDLRSVNPKLAAEWHPSKNGDLSPDKITSRSSRVVWWLGRCGHEWKASILNRSNGSGCPYCSGNKTLPGFNDFASSYPELAVEWDYDENQDLFPDMVTPKSNIKVGWVCRKGHKWKAKIEDRVHGNGCPVCAGRICLPGFNDLVTVRPELAQEWHPTKNGRLKPESLTKGSNKRVWWLGKCGHEWQAAINSRANGTGCPICSSTVVAEGVNDLSTCNPDLAKEWNYEKNGDLRPSMVMSQSNKKVWWVGQCGHEWQATIASRFNGNGCPICNGRLISSGINDLATINPELASEWHAQKNGDLLPTMVAKTSHKKVWWLGKCGHEWQDSIAHRYGGRGCPFCSNRRILVGFNDLATIKPNLAKEWDVEKNGSLKPQAVTAGSSKKVWWRGACGHVWQATIKNRANGTGCPVCKYTRARKQKEAQGDTDDNP